MFNGTLKAGLFLASNGVTFVQNNNYVCSEKFVSVISGETYSISNKNEIAGIYYVLEYDENKNFIKASNNSTTATSFTTTISSNCCYIRCEIGNSSAAPTVAAIEDFQIEKGPATEYEQYGTSPSPDYPSPIENITGDIEIKDVGKNLVKQMNWKQLPSVSTGATVTSVNGYGTDYIAVDNTEQYIFSYLGTAGSRYIVYYDKDKNFLGYDTNLQINNFAKWSETGYVRLRVDCSQDSVTDFQLEIGLEETDCEPYKSQVVTFPLGEEKLMKGSYLADDGIHHKRKQVVLDGTETGWYTLANQAGTNTSYFAIHKSDMKKASTLICDKFINRDVWNTDEEAIQSIIDNYIRLRINTSRASTVAELKTWLSQNPITLEYELSEEEIVPYTAEQQTAWEKIKNLKLFEGVNHISSDANMVLKYYPLEPVGLKFVLRIDIEKKQETTKLIDTTLPEVTDYNKIYEEDVTAKVQVYIREDGSEYNLYLKTDRTTTKNKDDPDRASGKIEVISVETADRAEEEALNVMKGNNYKHLVEFKIAKTSKLMDITQLHIGRPIRIKTDDDIYDSYISAITLSDEKFVYFKSGSLRITLLDKLKKTSNTGGDKLDRTGGKITGNLDVSGTLKENGKKVITDLDNINTEITSVAVNALAVQTDTTEHILKSFAIETAGRYMFLADVPLNYYRSNR